MKCRRLLAAGLAVAGVAAIAPAAAGSPPSGITAPVLVTADLDHKVKLHSDGITLRTRRRTDVRVQRFVFEPGGTTGWHHHPGIVIIAVESGTLTLWDSRCRQTEYGPGLPNGAVFTESGDGAVQVTSTGGATSYVTYLVPEADPPVFRIEDDPPHCA